MNQVINGRIGDWLQLYTGKPFWPLDPRVEDIDIKDIAHALSMKCRYGGHCTKFLSVAEHCVHLTYHVDGLINKKWALLHDAPEAYSADVPRPLKGMLVGWVPMEENIMRTICDRYGLPHGEPREVKYVDYAICSDEKEQIMRPSQLPWGELPPALGVNLLGLAPEQAEQFFLSRFYDLFPEESQTNVSSTEN